MNTKKRGRQRNRVNKQACEKAEIPVTKTSRQQELI